MFHQFWFTKGCFSGIVKKSESNDNAGTLAELGKTRTW